MKRSAIAFLFCVATTTAAMAEPWVVMDGSPSNITNVWDIVTTDNQVLVSAGVIDTRGFGPGSGRVSFNGVVLNDEHRLTFPSIGGAPECLFVGRLMQIDKIVGVATCAGRSSYWRAVRMQM